MLTVTDGLVTDVDVFHRDTKALVDLLAEVDEVDGTTAPPGVAAPVLPHRARSVREP